jgi:hypothetical protein
MKEEWKDIINYEGIYQVSSFGNVVRLPERKTLSPSIKSNGYKRVSLCKNGSVSEVNVHRLVALHFIHNPDNKPTVNHKDGIKTNNMICNLEWATMSEQMLHSSRILKNKHGDNLHLIHLNKELTNKRLAALRRANNSKNIERFKGYVGQKNVRARLLFHKETGIFLDCVRELMDLYKLKSHTSIVQMIKKCGHYKGFYYV